MDTYRCPVEQDAPVDPAPLDAPGRLARWLAAGAVGSGLASLIAFVFGVVLTSGVWASRRSWLLGVVLPLLAVTALLAELASRSAGPGPTARWTRVLARGALVLVAMPFALVLCLLGVYLVGFIGTEVHHLLR